MDTLLSISVSKTISRGQDGKNLGKHAKRRDSEVEHVVRLDKESGFEKGVTCALFLCCVIGSVLSEAMLVATVTGVALSALFLPSSASFGMRVSYTTGFLIFLNWFVFWNKIAVSSSLRKSNHVKVLVLLKVRAKLCPVFWECLV